ncbi:hypothetical protein ACFDTO_23605 [Microbacteriaceae bacterium 4G12]
MMRLDNNDTTIIEHALQVAVANSTDYQEIYQYQSVLEKFKKALDTIEIEPDGFRYDYDDRSNV